MSYLPDTLLSSEAKQAKEEARRFAADEIEPVAADYYESGEYPEEVLEAAQDAGLVGGEVAEEYGGRGYTLEQRLAVIEELFRADAGIGLTLQIASFGTELIEAYGSEDQIRRFVEPVARGDQISGLGATEPDTGSDLAGMKTRAEQDGDEWVVNGEKYWVSNGVAADWVVLYAKTADGDDPYQNYSLFVLPGDATGATREPVDEKMGMRASQQAHIVLDDCRIPAENLIGEEGQGFYYLSSFFNPNRVLVAGHALGVSAAAIEEARSFTEERREFGQSVGEFQSVRHRLADMEARHHAARALTYDAARYVTDDDNPSYWASLAKLQASEASQQTVTDAMQLHGGQSMVAENRITRLYRDAHITRVYEGVNEVQRNIIDSNSPNQ